MRGVWWGVRLGGGAWREVGVLLVAWIGGLGIEDGLFFLLLLYFMDKCDEGNWRELQ